MNRSGITVIAAVASCMLVGGVHGQGQGQWAFGDSILSDQGDRIHAAMDGDLLVCGSEIVTRVDGASSAVEWRRRVEGFYPQDVIEASDGRVVAVGLWIDSAGGQGIAMIFFDALGNHVGHRVFPGRAGGEHHEVIETANGGFLIAAEGLSSTGGLRPLLIRTDVAGDLQWCRRYDMPDFPFGEGEFCDVEETRLDDGRSIFHLTGRFREDSLQKHDTLMTTIDDAGDPIASSTLGFTGFTDFGRGLRLLSDGYLVTGYSKEIGEGGGTYLMRLASDFSLQWYRTLQEFSGTKAIDLTIDGMVRMPGTSSFPDPIRGAAIIEIPLAAPNSAAGVRYGGVVVDDGFEFAPEAGGGYALIGRTLSYGTVQADVYLVRTDADLLSGCEEASYEVVVSPDQIPGRELKLLPVPLRMPRQPEMDPQVEDWFEVTICEDDPAGPCADPPIEMVGWWTMDELAGTIAADSMSGLDGVHVNGPQIVSGLVGNAIDLDGIDDHLRIGPDPLLGLDAAAQPTGDITVDAWIRIDSNGPMEWGPVMSVAGSCAGWAFYVRDDRLEAAFSDGPLQARWTSTTVLPHGSWVHVAFACDRGLPMETTRFYVDGVEEIGVNAFPFTPTLGPLPGSVGFIGRMNPFCSAGNAQPVHFDGGIDEVEYFRRALDASEIQAIHAAGESGKCKVSCDPPWDQPFCIDDMFIDVTIPVCNASQVDADVDLSFNPLSPPDCGGIVGPTGFAVLTGNPVLVPAGQCVNVVVRIDRPVGMNALNLVGCYEMVLENLVDGRVGSCRGSVQDRRDLCPQGPLDPVELSVGEPAEIDLPFVDTGFEAPIIEWRAVAYGPDMEFTDAFSIDGGLPGTSGSGEVPTSPGSKGVISFDLRASRYVSGMSDVVVFTRSGASWNPLASFGIRVEPGVYVCLGDLNGDFKVDGGDLGMILGDWGVCGGCPTDLNGDGLVGGADLGVFLADWGECSQ